MATGVDVGDPPFTRVKAEGLHDFLSADIQAAAERIVAGLAGCRSLLLTGGFSRGEGGVLIDRDGFTPVNDYDFVAVVEGEVDADRLRALRGDVAAGLAIDHVDILTLPRDDLGGLVAYQFNYDLKYGGRVVWGEDTLALIPDFAAADIPIDSCDLVLVNRVICLLECYSEDFARRRMTSDETFFLAIQTAKAILACAEALLIRVGEYHQSYAERAQRIGRVFPERIALVELVAWATEFKLRPTRDPAVDGPWLWTEAVREYFAVLGSFPALFERQRYDQGVVHPPGEAMPFLIGHLLQADNRLHPIERIEMFLIGCRVAGFFSRRRLIKRARQGLKELTGRDSSKYPWEQLRRETVELWHQTLG